MCIFSGQTPEIVEGLLKNADDFPIPVQDNFGGDVMIGWKHLKLRENGILRSPVFPASWEPGKVLRVKGSGPSVASGQGIYAYGTEDKVASASIYCSVALWGRVLNFRHGYIKGCMAQFAFPLEITMRSGLGCYSRERAMEVAQQYGPHGVEVWHASKRLA